MAQGVHGGKVVDTRAQEQELAQRVSGSVQPPVDRVELSSQPRAGLGARSATSTKMWQDRRSEH